MASAADDCSLRLYRVLGSGVGGEATGDLILELSLDDGVALRCLSFVGDNLLGGGDKGTLSVWQVQRADDVKDCNMDLLEEAASDDDGAQALWSCKHHGDHSVICVEVCASAETIVTLAEDGSMCVFSSK